MVSQYFEQSRELSNGGTEARKLIARYPQLSEQEVASLIEMCATLPFLDFSILASDEAVGANFAAFYDDHGAKLRPPVMGWSWAAAPILVMSIGLFIWALS